MTNFDYSTVCSEVDRKYFVGVYKDWPEDTWFNICFVNNCGEEIKCLKVEAIEFRYNEASESNEVLGALANEYVNICPGEYLLLEKLDSLDSRVDGYKYSFVLESGGKTVDISCTFHRDDFSSGYREGIVPLINESGRVYFCM